MSHWPACRRDAESKAQDLKSKANSHFSAQRHAEATKLYTKIVETYRSDANPETIRVARCNRAACYLELQEYELAADDCTFVLAGRGPIASKSITLKAHLRLARSLQGLGKLDKALAELDRFRALNGGVSQAAEVKTRSQILEQQAAQDRATNERIEGGPPMRSIRYDVRAGPFPPIVINEQAPVVICGPNPPEMPAKMFLAALVKKHDPAIMRSRDWMCWNCEKKAASMVHTPCSYLHLADPFIVDYVQPICENRGQCEKEARDFIAQQMSDIARVGRTS